MASQSPPQTLKESFTDMSLGSKSTPILDSDLPNCDIRTSKELPNNIQTSLFLNSTPYNGPNELAIKLSIEAKEQGNLMFQTGNFNSAIFEYTKALYYWPSNLYCYLNRARACAKLQIHDQSIADAYQVCSILAALAFSVFGEKAGSIHNFVFPVPMPALDWMLHLEKSDARSYMVAMLPKDCGNQDSTSNKALLGEVLPDLQLVHAKSLLIAAFSWSQLGIYHSAFTLAATAAHELSSLGQLPAASKLQESAKAAMQSYQSHFPQDGTVQDHVIDFLHGAKCFMQNPLNGYLRDAVEVFRDPERLNQLFFLDNDSVQVKQVTHGGNSMLGVFARRDLQPGEVVISEKPILVCNSGIRPRCDTCGTPVVTETAKTVEWQPRACRICHLYFCSERCQETADSSWHPILCAPVTTPGSYASVCFSTVQQPELCASLQTPATMKVIAMALAQGCNPLLLPEFAHLHFRPDGVRGNVKYWSPCFELGIAWLGGIAQCSHNKHLTPHLIAHALSYFSVNAAAGRLLLNSFGENSSISEGGGEVGDNYTVLARTSLVNHSCEPNCVPKGNTLTVSVPIREGEEVFISYVNSKTKSNMELHRKKLEYYEVECNCRTPSSE